MGCFLGPKALKVGTPNEVAPMKRLLPLMLLGLLGLSACDSTREVLGLTKRQPDEFRVVTRAPLSLPPDYSLRAPTPGAPRPQEGTSKDQAQAAVFGYQANGQPVGAAQQQIEENNELVVGEGENANAQSAGESVILQSASVSGIDPNIRQLVDSETNEDEANSRDFVDSLVFWRAPEPYGTVIDPTKEQKRLQENAALGKPTTEGETPVIVRKKKGLLEGLF